jgi:predicted permease
MFFRPLPVRAPGELVYLYQTLLSGQVFISSYREMEYLRQHSNALAGVTAHWGRPVLFAVDGETESIQGEHVAANYFDVLGVKAQLGRTFLPEEDLLSSTQPAVVISDEWWTRRFKRDPSVVGRRVRLDNKEFTIVGIAEPGFTGLSNPWTPSRYWVTSVQFSGAEYIRFGVGVVGRIRPGLTMDQARAMLAGETEQMSREQAERARALGFRGAGTPLPHVILPVSSVRTPFDPRAEVVPARLLSAVTIVVAIVLLIAAANIAGILMARGVARTSELAARRALGASAARLARQLFTESVVLSLVGGLAGLAVAEVLVGLYRALTPPRYLVDVALDVRVLVFTAGVCLAAGIVVGLAPAIQGLRVDIVSALGTGAVAGSTRRTRRRFRHAIILPQVALALVLLVVAGVHVRALRGIERAGLGYEIQDRVVMRASYWDPGETTTGGRLTADEIAKRAERSREFYRHILSGLRNLPPAAAVALTDRLPTYSAETPATYISENAFAAGGQDLESATRAAVSPGYFRAMGMRAISGRDFDDRDEITAPPVAIVSERLAEHLWPGADPIGHKVAAYTAGKADQKIRWLEVVGVVNEVDPILHDRGEFPFVYVPLSQQWQPGSLAVVVRMAGDPSAAIRDVKNAIVGADTFAQVSGILTLKEVVGEILYPRRTAASLLALSGLVGLVLASIGLYGVVSYSVSQRTREIGVRIALGADRRAVRALVFREAAIVTGAGVVSGLLISAYALRITSTLVGPMPTSDMLVFWMVPALVAGIVLLGCYLPAARAAKIDPIQALRAG